MVSHGPGGELLIVSSYEGIRQVRFNTRMYITRIHCLMFSVQGNK